MRSSQKGAGYWESRNEEEHREGFKGGVERSRTESDEVCSEDKYEEEQPKRKVDLDMVGC
mgnify:CR=1 FL=1